VDTPHDSQAKQHRINPRYERYRWQVFGITWLAYAGFYLTRKAFSVAKTELERPDAGGWTKSDMAWIDGTYLTTYAMGQFLWGMLGDRFGTRVVILVGMAASVLVCAAMGFSSTVVAFAVLFGIQGLCQSSGWAPLAKNIGEFFSQKERGRVMGFWCMNYALGGFVASAIAGIAITTALDQGVGAMSAWRYAFWVAAVLLAGIWVLFWLLQHNRPEDVGLPPIEVYHDEPVAVAVEEDAAEEEMEGSWKVIMGVLSNRMVLLLAVVYFFLKPTRYVVLFSAPLYVKFRLEQVGLDASAAELGILGSMFDLAGPLGALFGGFVSDKVFHTRRMPASVIALLLLGVFLLVFPNLPPTRTAIGAGFFLIGFLLYIPDSLISGTAAIDFGTKKGASTAAGVINGFGSIGAIIGGTMPGWIESVVGKGTDVWGYVFGGLSISIFIGAALLLPKWNQLPPVAERRAAS
jgi:OPA family sugar phosphate sensor protein UhpC-like MFS transporter